MFRIVFTLCIGKTMTCDSGFRIPGFRAALVVDVFEVVVDFYEVIVGGCRWL